MKQTVRVTFDAQAAAAIERIRTRFGTVAPGEAISCAIRLLDAIQNQAACGFTEIYLHNPKTEATLRLGGPILGPKKRGRRKKKERDA